MKKFTILGLAIMLSACAESSSSGGLLSAFTATDANSSVRQRMQSCMLLEAQSKFQAGTLFTQGLSATADELVATCAKKLALQAAGINDDNRTAAENIITNLKNLAQ
ncbi:MAG: hypothetical protein ILA52_00740 [Alphaproteobacteria bacterium]|nr:hypothetical protein [Alphaproteobacteria bacterium]